MTTSFLWLRAIEARIHTSVFVSNGDGLRHALRGNHTLSQSHFPFYHLKLFSSDSFYPTAFDL